MLFVKLRTFQLLYSIFYLFLHREYYLSHKRIIPSMLPGKRDVRDVFPAAFKAEESSRSNKICPDKQNRNKAVYCLYPSKKTKNLLVLRHQSQSLSRNFYHPD